MLVSLQHKSILMLIRNGCAKFIRSFTQGNEQNKRRFCEYKINSLKLLINAETLLTQTPGCVYNNRRKRRYFLRGRK